MRLGGTFHDLLYPESGLVADHKAFIKKRASGIAHRYGLDPIEVESRAIAIAVAAQRDYSPSHGSFKNYLLVRFKELHRVYGETHLLVPTGITKADIKAEKLEARGEQVDIKFPGRGPRLVIDKQWQRVWDFTSELFNEISRRANTQIENFGRLIYARDIKRIVVGIQLWASARAEAIARSLHDRIAAHVIPLAQLFERQKPATFRGWTRACLDHFLRRYREADQEAANADYRPVFLEADRATVEVKLARPRRMERSLNTHVRPVSLDQPITTVDADGPNGPMTLKDIITAPAFGGADASADTLKDKAEALLPRLKGNERAVFEALLTGDPMTTQRDLAKATGLTEGAVSKILRRLTTKAAQK
jgi:hypothetical protein